MATDGSMRGGAPNLPDRKPLTAELELEGGGGDGDEGAADGEKSAMMHHGRADQPTQTCSPMAAMSTSAPQDEHFMAGRTLSEAVMFQSVSGGRGREQEKVDIAPESRLEVYRGP